MTNPETMFVLRELAEAFAKAFARRIARGQRAMPRHRDTDRMRDQAAARRAAA